MRGGIGSIGVLLVALSCAEPPPIPDPDTSSMEPEVARRIRDARSAVVSDPSAAERWGELAMVFHAHDRFEEAKESYAAARKLDPGDSRWPYLEARCALALQDLERAAEAARAALALAPDYAPVHVLEAELHEKADRREEALASYRKALALDSRSAAAELGIGRIELARGNVAEAIEHLERASQREPGSGSILALLARAYQRAGEEERARAAADRARVLPPEVSLHDPVMAAVLERSVSISGFQRRAAEAESRGDHALAETLLERLVAMRPEDPNFHYNLANHFSRKNALEDAAREYRSSLALDPHHVGALANFGSLLARSGRAREARELLSRALELEPENAFALSSLAKVHALSGNFGEAIHFFEKAIAADPRQVETHYAMGQVLHRQGRLDRAAASYASALELAPDRGDIHLALAEAYAASGDDSNAWKHVQKARDLGIAAPEELIATLSRRTNVPRDP